MNLKKKKLLIITFLIFSFMDKTYAKYESVFFDYNIKSLDGNNIELSDYKK